MSRPMSAEAFGTEKTSAILLKIAPPVMLAQLIQALYNIVDSYFVGKFSEDALTALSVIYPLQLLITALSVGTGTGVNALMARRYAHKDTEKAARTGGMGILLAIGMWAAFALLSPVILKPFVSVSSNSQQVRDYAMTYGVIVCVGSLGTFLESCFSKIHQAQGNMKLPTAAQIAGAAVNIVFDPLLIFGIGSFPKMDVAGAALATVLGQFTAAVITGVKGMRKPPKPAQFKYYTAPIYRYAFPSILMQFLFVVYILALNIILAGFSDAAVTVLGLYYKLQTFFFIPLFALQTCIVPVLSYNYSRCSYDRCRAIMRESLGFSAGFMLLGVFCFEALPAQLIGIFSQSGEVLALGVPAFRIIGASFLPAAASLMMPTFFQAVGAMRQSSALALIRQVACLIPIFRGLSFLGVGYPWFAFPAAETITGTVGFILYFRELRRWKSKAQKI